MTALTTSFKFVNYTAKRSSSALRQHCIPLLRTNAIVRREETHSDTSNILKHLEETEYFRLNYAKMMFKG